MLFPNIAKSACYCWISKGKKQSAILPSPISALHNRWNKKLVFIKFVNSLSSFVMWSGHPLLVWLQLTNTADFHISIIDQNGNPFPGSTNVQTRDFHFQQMMMGDVQINPYFIIRTKIISKIKDMKACLKNIKTWYFEIWNKVLEVRSPNFH